MVVVCNKEIAMGFIVGALMLVLGAIGVEATWQPIERTTEWVTGWDIGPKGFAVDRGTWWTNPAGNLPKVD